MTRKTEKLKMSKKYIYKVIDNIDLESLNHWGSEGWVVCDIYPPRALLVKEIEE